MPSNKTSQRTNQSKAPILAEKLNYDTCMAEAISIKIKIISIVKYVAFKRLYKRKAFKSKIKQI